MLICILIAEFVKTILMNLCRNIGRSQQRFYANLEAAEAATGGTVGDLECENDCCEVTTA